MRIAILCHPTHGGSGVVASELALSLARRGHRVHVVSPGVPPRLARDPGPVALHRVRGGVHPLAPAEDGAIAATGTVLELLAGEGLDVVHAHYALPHAVSACLARDAARALGPGRVPRVVVTLHGTDVTLVGAEPRFAPLVRHALEGADAVTAVSRHLAERARALRGADAPAPEVLHNFVDTDAFRPCAERAAGPLRAVHVSNFRPLKRVPRLLEAFARAARGTEAELLLVGDGPDLPRCRERALELGLEGRVRFLGERDALPELLAPRDALLLTSREESFGLSALEAAACGLGVLATRVGGLPEVVEDGRTGRLVDPDDAAVYTEELAAWIADPERARAFGRAGRERARERFDRDAGVDRYEALYRRLTR